MKIYSFIAAVAVCALLASCSNDDQENSQLREVEIQQPNAENILLKEGDSLVVGDPFPPKPKG